jgi:tetratricopeptide (TPR) repeat protein
MNVFDLIYADDAICLAFLVAIFYVVGRNMATGKAVVWGQRAAALAYLSFVLYACANVSRLNAAELAYIAFRGLFAAGLALGTGWMGFSVLLFLWQHVQTVEKRVVEMPVKNEQPEKRAPATIDLDTPTGWKPAVRNWSKLPKKEFDKYEARRYRIESFEAEARNLLQRLSAPRTPPSPPPSVLERRRLKTQLAELELARQFFAESGDDPQDVGRALAECDARIMALKRALGQIADEPSTEPPQLEGIAICDEAIARRPNNPVLYVERAREFIHQRQYQNAIADCNRALNMLPGYYAAYHIRGIAYHYLRKYASAVRDFQRTIYENPKYGWGYAALATTYNAARCYREALGPAYYASYFNLAGDQQLAFAYEQLSDHTKAVEHFTKLIEGDPEGKQYPDARVRRSRQLMKLGQKDLAIHDLKTHLAGKSDPEAAELLTKLEKVPDQRQESEKTTQEEVEAEAVAARLNLPTCDDAAEV